MQTLDQLKSIHHLSTEQLEIIKYMIDPLNIENDITLSLEDVETILSASKKVNIVRAKNIEGLLEERSTYLNAMGAVILFEMSGSHPISNLTEWINSINESLHKNASLIFGCREEEEVEGIRMTMLCTHLESA